MSDKVYLLQSLSLFLFESVFANVIFILKSFNAYFKPPVVKFKVCHRVLTEQLRAAAAILLACHAKSSRQQQSSSEVGLAGLPQSRKQWAT